MSHTRRCTNFWVLALLTGCGDAERPVVATKHLSVELYDSDVICLGSLEDMEAQVVRVAEIFGVEVPPGIRVHYGVSAVDEHCSEEHGGCIWDRQNLAADDSSVYHEIVHAVRYGNGLRTTRFLEEGIAEVLSGFRPRPYQVNLHASEVRYGPDSLIGAHSTDFPLDNYNTAGHFTSWLRTMYGDSVLVSFLNDEKARTAETVGSAFARHFQRSVPEADAEWRALSAEEYVWGELCHPTRALAWNGAMLEFKGGIDCAEPNTSGPGHDGRIMTRGNCFELAEPGTLRVEFDASTSRAWASFTQVGCAPSEGDSYSGYAQKGIFEGESMELPFAACSWEIAVMSPTGADSTRAAADPMEFTVRLTRL